MKDPPAMKKSDYLKKQKSTIVDYMGKIMDIPLPCREVHDAYHGMIQALQSQIIAIEDEIKAALEAEHREGV
jgi:hypothetical protein